MRFVTPCHSFLVDQEEELCLELNATDEDGFEVLEFDLPVTVGLCYPNFLDGRDLALYRFEDRDETLPRDGPVVVLQPEPAPFVRDDCLIFDTDASAIDANPLIRFARAVWGGIKEFFRPKALLAFGDGGFGGLSPFQSFFVWAPEMFLRGALVRESGGLFKFEVAATLRGFASFDNTKPVTVTFGEGAGRFTEMIPAGSFELDPRKGVYQYKVKGKAAPGGQIKSMNITPDGRFEVTADRVELTGVIDFSNPESYVSFTVQIGGELQGVGITFNEDGVCVDPHGSGVCTER